MGENKRTQQRFDRRVEVEVGHGGETRAMWTRNMSLGGLFLETEARPPMGTKVTLRFRVPTQKEPIEVGAVVRWADENGFGVQFDGLRARDVWALGKFFEQPA